jgi:hypothetical protein
MSELEDLVAIEHALERLQRRELLKALRPGITAQRVKAILAPSALPATSDLESLYSWRNGTDAGSGRQLDDLHMFPGFYLLAIEDSVANYRAFAADRRWNPEWFPLFANGGGDFYVLDHAGPGGLIRHFRIDEDDHPVEFGSLAAMLKTIAEGFERGVFFVTEDGYLEMDDLLFAAVAAELNPEVEWWSSP